MPRVQQIPEQLRQGPFTVAFAERLGFSRHRLRGPNWRRLGCGIYVWTALEVGLLAELVAIQHRLPEPCVFSGRTAAHLYGLDLAATNPVEVTAPPGVAVRPRPDLLIRGAALTRGDVTTRGQLRVTSPVRTCFDLARSLDLVEAVVSIDAALQRGLVSLGELREYVARMGRARRVPAVRRVLELVEPNAESPMESRLRLVLVLGGLPRPAVQLDVLDAAGRFLGRPDLLYPDARLAIEYDGATHQDNLGADLRRQNRLQNAGYLLLRYTAADVYQRPETIIDQVRGQLAARRAA